MAFTIWDTSSGWPYKVKDVSLADSGRLKIKIAELQMPALMARRAKLAPYQPLKGAKITVSLHTTSEAAVFVETLTDFGAQVRWCSSNPFSTEDEAAAAVARDSAPVFAWKGETLQEYWWCSKAALYWGPHERGPDLIVDDNGDLTYLIHEGVKAEEVYEKTGMLPNPAPTEDARLQIAWAMIRDELTTYPNKYTRMKEGIVGVSGVEGLYHEMHSIGATGTLPFGAINHVKPLIVPKGITVLAEGPPLMSMSMSMGSFALTSSSLTDHVFALLEPWMDKGSGKYDAALQLLCMEHKMKKEMKILKKDKRELKELMEKAAIMEGKVKEMKSKLARKREETQILQQFVDDMLPGFL